MTSDQTQARPVLYHILCGAPPAAEAHEFVKLAQADGWDVQVIATRDGLRWLDTEMLAGADRAPGPHRVPDAGRGQIAATGGRDPGGAGDLQHGQQVPGWHS